MMEEKLNKLGIEELMILRCAFFMENFLRGMNFQAGTKRVFQFSV
jgi:hypothetical protein